MDELIVTQSMVIEASLRGACSVPPVGVKIFDLAQAQLSWAHDHMPQADYPALWAMSSSGSGSWEGSGSGYGYGYGYGDGDGDGSGDGYGYGRGVTNG